LFFDFTEKTLSMKTFLTLLGFYLAPIILWMVFTGVGVAIAGKLNAGPRLTFGVTLGPIVMIGTMAILVFQTFSRFGLWWSLGYLGISLLTFVFALMMTLMLFNR